MSSIYYIDFEKRAIVTNNLGVDTDADMHIHVRQTKPFQKPGVATWHLTGSIS